MFISGFKILLGVFGVFAVQINPMSLVKAMATVAGITGLSRIVGFVRDVMSASILGAGPVADAFFVALKLPNFFRRVTAEGAFSVSFVPLYTQAMTQEGQDKADDFARNAFAVMLLGLSVLSLLAMAFMPFIIRMIAPGFGEGSDDGRFPLAVDLTRITFPYLLLMSLSALLGGVLNAHERFAPFALAPVMFNVVMIFSLLVSGIFQTPGHAMAWGIAVSGVLQLGWLALSAKRIGFRLRLVRPRMDAKVKKVLKLMGPGVIGAGVMHINLFADMIIASLLPAGAISALYYADRLNQLPLGMVGIAVGTALLPMLSKAMAAGAQDGQAQARDLFNRALEYCLLLALPAAMALFVISWPIVVTLFRHGAFSWEAALWTTAALTSYAIGLPAYVLVKVFSTAFWARQDTLTPVKVSVCTTLLNIGVALYLVLVVKVGVFGIAVATAMAGWAQIILLGVFLRGREETRFDARLKRNGGKIVFSCLLMAIVLGILKAPLLQYFEPFKDHNHIAQIAALGFLVAAGGGVYGASVFFTGVLNAADIKRYLSRKR